MQFAITRMPSEYLVARIGSPEAKPLLPDRPDLADCSTCKQDVWVDRDHLRRCRKNGLSLICATCLESAPF
jgi:hypothetical protein